jgi:TRAP-type C4-dicarboxylate transport system substrate-binding protein
MKLSRRDLVAAALALPALSALPARAATKLKISHQFPGGTLEKGDFRDRLCRIFASELAKRTNGELDCDIYPNSSLMKTNAQISSLRKGALDMSLVPLSYAGGEMPEVNIGLMPCLVATYKQGMAWKTSPIGKALSDFLESKGLVVVSWVWQGGGVASRERALIVPEDVKGAKIRGGSREMDLMLQAAGAAVLSLPSNELYAAMQTGACDAGYTSSTSLISFRLEEVAKHLTAATNQTYWFMFEPLLMSKTLFDKLPQNHRDLIMKVGAEVEEFAHKEAMVDDKAVAEIYAKAGAKVHSMDAGVIEKWKAIARDTAWKDYAGKNANCAKLLDLAQQVPA